MSAWIIKPLSYMPQSMSKEEYQKLRAHTWCEECRDISLHQRVIMRALDRPVCVQCKKPL